MQSQFRILAIAIFITASYRLVPLPLGDTARAALYAIFVFLFSNIRRNWLLDISFFKAIWPLFAIMLLTLLFDIVLARTGTYLVVTWAKFLPAMLIASAVYTLTFKEIHLLILLSIGLLLAQLAMINLAPSYFISMAKSLGIVDPFVTYDKTLDRVYYAYFNANSASYAIYYIMLSYFALRRVMPKSRTEGILVVSILVLLALLTGGRGVILLTGGFWVTWFFSLRSTRAAMLASITTIGWAVAVPLYNSVIELILLREESNSARLGAHLEYLSLISENPFFGIGIEAARERAIVDGLKASHNFFLETLGMFGLPMGGALLLYLLYKMVIGPKTLSLRVIGLYAILVGVFNNALLTNWGFLPLLVPVLVLAGTAAKKQGHSSQSAPSIQIPRAAL